MELPPLIERYSDHHAYLVKGISGITLREYLHETNEHIGGRHVYFEADQFALLGYAFKYEHNSHDLLLVLLRNPCEDLAILIADCLRQSSMLYGRGDDLTIGGLTWILPDVLHLGLLREADRSFRARLTRDIHWRGFLSRTHYPEHKLRFMLDNLKLLMDDRQLRRAISYYIFAVEHYIFVGDDYAALAEEDSWPPSTELADVMLENAVLNAYKAIEVVIGDFTNVKRQSKATKLKRTFLQETGVDPTSERFGKRTLIELLGNIADLRDKRGGHTRASPFLAFKYADLCTIQCFVAEFLHCVLSHRNANKPEMSE